MNKKAFMMIELVIALALLAILAAITVPRYLEAQTRRNLARVHADMRRVIRAIEAYGLDNQGVFPYCYSPYLTHDQAHSAMHTFLDVEWKNGSNFLRWYGAILTTPVAYLPSIPWDAFTSQGYSQNPPSSWDWPSVPKRTSFLYIYGNHWDYPQDICPGVFIDDLYQDVGYGLYSVGPSAYMSWPPIIYDPTNGAVSRGHIVHLGHGNGWAQTTGGGSPHL